jgi:hypothetical protein
MNRGSSCATSAVDGAGFWWVVDDDGEDEDKRVNLHEATAPPAERTVA